MGKTIEGKLDATGKKFVLVVSRFNSFITDRLVEGALDCLKRHGADEKDIDLVLVPGAWEIPQVARRAAAGKKYDAVITLGAVIRGATPHFEYIAAEASKGIAQVAMGADKPVVFGVLTCDTIEQAVERAGTKAGNKGADAAQAAIEMINLFSELKS
jgi:6,7-dimethyl-8-ribityllumazine synthase